MGRWLAELKELTEAEEGNPQNLQNPYSEGFEGFEGSNSVEEENSSFGSLGAPGEGGQMKCQVRPFDTELYADVLRVHGPMSYGMAMEKLGWGATRAGKAETQLLKEGRIRFNALGRAVLKANIDRSLHLKPPKL